MYPHIIPFKNIQYTRIQENTTYYNTRGEYCNTTEYSIKINISMHNMFNPIYSNRL